MAQIYQFSTKQLLLILLLTLSLFTCVCTAEQKTHIDIISGVARVLDGDTIAIGEHRIRLAHIDAPELKQECENKSAHQFYKCGEQSRDALETLARGHKVTCHIEKLDIFKRMLGVCFIFGLDINEYMILTGNAILYKSDKAYIEEQIEARQSEIGMWASSFDEPWTWRKEQKIKARAAKVSKTIN